MTFDTFKKLALHALRPYNDSRMNHIRHFIKIPFINKGIDFIDLPSIFRDNTVESSISNYYLLLINLINIAFVSQNRLASY